MHIAVGAVIFIFAILSAFQILDWREKRQKQKQRQDQLIEKLKPVGKALLEEFRKDFQHSAPGAHSRGAKIEVVISPVLPDGELVLIVRPQKTERLDQDIEEIRKAANLFLKGEWPTDPKNPGAKRKPFRLEIETITSEGD